jgi:hypothetical protein
MAAPSRVLRWQRQRLRSTVCVCTSQAGADLPNGRSHPRLVVAEVVSCNATHSYAPSQVSRAHNSVRAKAHARWRVVVRTQSWFLWMHSGRGDARRMGDMRSPRTRLLLRLILLLWARDLLLRIKADESLT